MTCIYPIVVSQVTSDDETWQLTIFHKGNETIFILHLHSAFEEADLRTFVHIKDALEAGYNVCVVISNDTDVIVALIYQMQMFLQCNLHDLWVRAGVGDTTRYIPLHTLYGCLGDQLFRV